MRCIHEKLEKLVNGETWRLRKWRLLPSGFFKEFLLSLGAVQLLQYRFKRKTSGPGSSPCSSTFNLRMRYAALSLAF